MKKILLISLFASSACFAQSYDDYNANAYADQVRQQEMVQQQQAQMQEQQRQIDQQQRDMDNANRGGNPNNPFGFNYVGGR